MSYEPAFCFMRYWVRQDSTWSQAHLVNKAGVLKKSRLIVQNFFAYFLFKVFLHLVVQLLKRSASEPIQSCDFVGIAWGLTAQKVKHKVQLVASFLQKMQELIDFSWPNYIESYQKHYLVLYFPFCVGSVLGLTFMVYKVNSLIDILHAKRLERRWKLSCVLNACWQNLVVAS